jgi:hypothetical protein
MTLQVDIESEAQSKRTVEMMFWANLGWRAANPVGRCLVAVCRAHVGGAD